jgi:mRNA-degrading endonuclease RelE of RelBE toxin-antitoxin system
MTAALQFYIADTFVNSLARLRNEEQKAVKTTAFDLQLNPENPGMRFHKVDGAWDKNFWSVRVSRDLRIIIHKVKTSLVLCFVGHHDRAYEWAERRTLEAHPLTGAAQLIMISERVSIAEYYRRETGCFAKLGKLKYPELEESSFTHPHAQPHFQEITNLEELVFALDLPRETWPATERVISTPAYDLTEARPSGRPPVAWWHGLSRFWRKVG